VPAHRAFHDSRQTDLETRQIAREPRLSDPEMQQTIRDLQRVPRSNLEHRRRSAECRETG
jgi:hypothetical protein